MVSHNLEFVYNGYKLPPKARAPRSVRKSRVLEKKIPEDDTICAFDLLATIAGNLLLESRNSNSLCSSEEPVNVGEDKCVAVQNSVENEFQIDEKPINLVSFSKENPCKELPIPIDDLQCGVSSGDKVESNLNGSDSCQVRKFSEESKVGVAGDAVVLDAKPDVVVSIGSKRSTEMPVCGRDAYRGSRDGVNLVSRDDDENFSGYIRPCMTKTLLRSVSRNGDGRIRKILASRHWKGGVRNADAKPWYCSKRDYYLHHQRNYPIKKRKYLGRNFDLVSDYSLHGKAHKGNRIISSIKSCRNASFVSRDHHVRLRIKSFRVPEFFIEFPETATVGSLKRVVMEAVTRKLSDGLQVGLMIQGKKVQDDNKTLLQTGISQENTHIHSLGFSLESSSETSYSQENAVSNLQTCDDISISRTANIANLLDSDHDSAPYRSDSLGNISRTDDSGALVPVSAAVESSPKARTVLVPQPPSHKSKSTEQQLQQVAAHRRIRRPFSVSEVEALVQAVEQLGTGRWRDVKLRAFEDTGHRTYVDLKDKWKTLVHTARIPPQQRRGEAVPQDVLDRVLKAHAYCTGCNQHVNKEQEQLES